jgi:pimeloyl-ACP methyl ester carboxylesterase
MPFTSVNGINLHYATAGDGPPLLMIAGFASDNVSWAPVTTPLAKSRRLIMPDNRASGQTLAAGAPVSLHHYAEDCLALVDRLGLKTVDVLGHSMGGVIAMELAATWPGRVRKLVLAATAPSISAHSRDVIRSLTALREAGAPEADWTRNFFTWLFQPAFFEDARAVDAAVGMAMGYPHRQSPADMRRQCDAMEGIDLRERLSSITADALVMAGGKDLLFPLDQVEAAFAKTPFRVEVVRNAAHSIHWDDPARFATAVLDFLE